MIVPVPSEVRLRILQMILDVLILLVMLRRSLYHGLCSNLDIAVVSVYIHYTVWSNALLLKRSKDSGMILL
jgi:hypothetical protein